MCLSQSDYSEGTGIIDVAAELTRIKPLSDWVGPQTAKPSHKRDDKFDSHSVSSTYFEAVL